MLSLNAELKLKKITKCNVNVEDLDDFIEAVQDSGMLVAIFSEDGELVGEDDLLDGDEFVVALFKLRK